ncbi:MAG: restriction endonuclease subunit S [Thiotrichales bacterium]
MTGNGQNKVMSLPAIDHLDIWTSAWEKKASGGRGGNGKLSPYGIQKLRELILQLAVMGKLVPQDPNDEPASVLLEKIAKEKARLVKEGKFKKLPNLPDIEDHERPNELPNGWEIVRLGDIVRVINGRAYKKHEMLSEGTPLLRVGNLFTSNEWYYSNLDLEPDKYIDNGDLIYAWSASFGPFIWDGGRAIYHYHIWKLDFFDESNFDKRFLYRYLEAETDRIKASGSGIAMIHMTKDRMEKLIVPIPPLAEQHRIVAKVDELMALCDRLEQEQTDSREAHQTLVETLLRTLTEAPDDVQEARVSREAGMPGATAEAAQQAWQRIAEHFDLLFTTEAAIDQLKQTILQLAVMGKLVPQNPADEPASVLLEKIAKEKARLVKEGKIKKQKKLPEITEEEKPFELPEGWAWAFIPQVVTNDKYSIKRGLLAVQSKKIISCRVDTRYMNSKMLLRMISHLGNII